MNDTFRFPNGYDVKICRKQDIIDCINDNITDKEIALAIVEQCESDAAEFIKQGKWASIPFIGNFRIPKNKQLELSEEQQALISEAKDTLDADKYILFRTQLGKDNNKKVKQERYYRYITSMAVTKNRKVYNRLCKTKGEQFARLFLYTCANVNVVSDIDNIYDINMIL